MRRLHLILALLPAVALTVAFSMWYGHQRDQSIHEYFGSQQYYQDLADHQARLQKLELY